MRTDPADSGSDKPSKIPSQPSSVEDMEVRQTNSEAVPADWDSSTENAHALKRRKDIEQSSYIFAVGTLILAVLSAPISARMHSSSGNLVSSILGAGLFAAFGMWLSGRVEYRNTERRFRRRYERLAHSRRARYLVRLAETPTLGALFKMNQVSIEDYHEIALRHADRAFRNAQLAMFIGLGLLAMAGAIALVPATDTVVKVTVGALGAVGGAASGYISRTFLRSHDISVSQLNNFFREPLINSYLLAAERLAEGLPGDHKANALARIINQAIDSARSAERNQISSGVAASRSPRRRRDSGRRAEANAGKNALT